MTRPAGPRSTVLFAFAVAIGLYLAWLLHDVLLVIYVSALFAVVLMPVVRAIMMLRIGRWHPGRGMAVLILLVLTAGGLTLFFIVGLTPAFRDLREFIKELPQRGPEFFARLQKLPVLRDIDLDALQEKVQDMTANIATYVVRFATNWAGRWPAFWPASSSPSTSSSKAMRPTPGSCPSSPSICGCAWTRPWFAPRAAWAAGCWARAR